MDEALLGEPLDAFVAHHRPAADAAAPAASLAGNWRARSLDQASAVDSDAAVRAAEARRLAMQRIRASKADSFYRRARQAEADGKRSVARIYYQMAARRASGELKSQIWSRLAAIDALRNGKVAQNHAAAGLQAATD